MGIKQGERERERERERVFEAWKMSKRSEKEV
jgi:hypothetical protein